MITRREVSTARPARAGPALFMLLLVAAGLFTMHTLGHFSMPTTMPATHLVASMDTVAHNQAVAPPADQPSMPMGSVVACVAILCGLMLFAVAAVLAGRARVYGRASDRALRPVIDAVRGPPTILIGLCLADLSVAWN